MAGCIVPVVSQPSPGNDDPERFRAGDTIRRGPMLPAGGVFVPLRALISAPPAGCDDPSLYAAGTTTRTPLGQSFFQVWPRVVSQQPQGEQSPQDGWTARGQLQGTGLVPAPIVPRRTSYPPEPPPEPQESGWTRRSPILGTGQAAAFRVPPRPVYSDDSQPADGWTTRGKLAPTGRVGNPLVPRRVSEPPPAPQPEDGWIDRIPLVGTGQVPAIVVPRSLMSQPPAGCDDPNLYTAGTTWRQGPVMLSNDGQVIAGPYSVDAMAIFQAGAVTGVIVSEG